MLKWLVVCLAGFSLCLGIMTGVLMLARQGDSTAYFLLWEHEGVIYRMSPDGQDITRLTDFSEPVAILKGSPNGVVVAGSYSGKAYQLHANGKHETLAEIPQDYRLQYSPDGKWVSFDSFTTGDVEIAIMPRDVSQEPINLTQSPNRDASSTWSPDGKWLAFASSRDGNSEIYKMRPDGSNVQRLTTTRLGEEDFPLWSFDGKWIYYTGDITGDLELYRMHTDGTHTERLTRWTGLDWRAEWSEAIDGTWHPLRLAGLALGLTLATVILKFATR